MDDQETKLQAIQADVSELVNQYETFSVDSEGRQTEAINMLSQIKTRIKRIDDLRKFFVQPLNDQVKSINNKFRVNIDALKRIEGSVQTSLNWYVRTKEEEARKKHEAEVIKREELLKKAEAEAKKSKSANKRVQESLKVINEQIPMEAPPQTVRTAEGVMSVKKVWKFEIVDIEKVSKKYWKVDETLIRKDIMNGEREIAGVRIYQDVQTAIR